MAGPSRSCLLRTIARLARVLAFGAFLLASAASLAAAEPWRRHVIDGSSRGADGVRLADVNGDGLPDVVTGWEEGGRVRVYVNPGPARSREPWPAVTAGSVRSPEDAVLVDLDGDGSLDVVSSCEGSTRSIYFHFAPRDRGRYLEEAAWSTVAVAAVRNQQAWMYALPLDVDGRNGVDLVVGAKNQGAQIGWLESPANPRDAAAWRYHKLRDAGWIMSLESHDMDGDGDLDVLASDRKGDQRGVFWLENPGPQAAAEGAAWREHKLGGSDRQVMFLTRGDLDGDGRPDVACAVSGGNGIALWRATGRAGAPFEQHEAPMPANCGTGKAIAMADVNGDGRADLVFTCENAAGEKSGARWLQWRESPWSGAWEDREISGPVGTKFDRIEMLDLDGDGDLDLLTCEEAENLGVIWYENPTR